MNLPDLTQRVRQHLAEAGTGAFNDDRIQDQIRRSARDLARQFRLFKAVQPLTLDTNGNAATPTDLAGVLEVNSANGALPLVTPDVVAAYTGPWPYAAYYWGDEYNTAGKVLFWGPVREPVTLTYYRVPPNPTTERQAWEGKYEEYHDLIGLHAAHQLSGQTGASAAKDAIWLQRLEQRKTEFQGYLATARIGGVRMQFTPGTRFPSRRRY